MPKIKHTLLRWARETSKLSIEEAAGKLSLTDTKVASAAEKLVAFENGKNEPSRSLLLRMSKHYHRPLLMFYLNEPPKIGDRGEDFRTLPDSYDDVESANVDVIIRDIRARQSTVREALIEEDEGIRLEFIGKCKIDQGVPHVVQTIRKAIDIRLDEYRVKLSHKEAFKHLRQQIEAANIFVVLKGNLGSYHTNIAVTAFRGFALADDIAPFIVINDRDAEVAWSFTLMHEMAHLFLGQTGISGANAEKKIEKFCNNVASEILLPTAEFDAFHLTSSDVETLKSKISEYAFLKKLSSSHIAYRLYRRGDIKKQLWESLRKYYRDMWFKERNTIKEKNKKKDSGPNYYKVKNYKLGVLVSVVQRMTYSGTLTTTKAGMLLDVKPLKVHRLFHIEQFA